MEDKIYESIDESLEQANKSVVPFQVTKDEELAVVGDANATELNKHDFKIAFKVPTDTGYQKYEKEFKGIYLKPRHETRLVKFMTELLPFFRKVTGEGNVVKYEPLEREQIKGMFSEGIYDLMYDLVATVLGIDQELKDYMTQASVAQATVQIVQLYPELVNESDTFFG